jgi:FKBP-type peptidyl-prolyl cis-trans isomerase (trigger factor)
LTISLPEDFPRKDLAGKTAAFEVRVKEAKERILPEPDDDFAKDLGEFETFGALKEEIEKAANVGQAIPKEMKTGHRRLIEKMTLKFPSPWWKTRE